MRILFWTVVFTVSALLWRRQMRIFFWTVVFIVTPRSVLEARYGLAPKWKRRLSYNPLHSAARAVLVGTLKWLVQMVRLPKECWDYWYIFVEDEAV